MFTFLFKSKKEKKEEFVDKVRDLIEEQEGKIEKHKNALANMNTQNANGLPGYWNTAGMNNAIGQVEALRKVVELL